MIYISELIISSLFELNFSFIDEDKCLLETSPVLSYPEINSFIRSWLTSKPTVLNFFPNSTANGKPT